MTGTNNSAYLPDELSQLAITSTYTDSVQVVDIFEAVFTKLNQLYNIDCASLVLYDQQHTKIRVAYIIETAGNTGDVSTSIITDEIELNAITKEIASFQFPMLKTRAEWEQEFVINHCLLNNNAGYNFHCYIPLENNEQILGTLELHNSKKGLSADGLNFCSSIADLLADIVNRLKKAIVSESQQGTIALSESVVNNTAFEKEQDHQMLLSFSSTIVTVKDKADLAKLINKQFKQFSFLANVIITTLNADSNTHSIYIANLPSELLKSANFAKVSAETYPTEDGLFNRIANSTEPVIFKVEDLLINEFVPGYVRFWHQQDVEQIMGIALSKGTGLVGVLYIALNKNKQVEAHQYSFIKAISAQVSLALVNILAQEKIHQQLVEIENYKRQLEQDTLFVEEEVKANNYAEIIGRGPEMQQVFNLLTQVGNSDSTVLILGDTGTGKELIARAIHNDSARRGQAMIKVNCAAIPPNLIESELFGHEKGSFTGATERRIGKFELANNSTLFLDEIGELSLELQVKLLRVLQEKEIERVGGSATIKTDVRVVAATNRSLLEEVEAGRFRRDLFYRLNVFPINVPPLRNRKDDIPLLAMHFLNKFVEKSGKNITGFSQKALKELTSYHWPGNVRELEHLIERQVLLSKSSLIKTIPFPDAGNAVIVANDKVVKVKTIDENERDHIFMVLKSCQGKVSGAAGAAKLLGVPATTLNSKIKRLGLTKKHLY